MGVLVILFRGCPSVTTVLPPLQHQLPVCGGSPWPSLRAMGRFPAGGGPEGTGTAVHPWVSRWGWGLGSWLGCMRRMLETQGGAES